jgi:signal peptidase I
MHKTELHISGNSMYPAIQERDRLETEIFDEPRKLNDFQEGDVVLLRPGGEWIIHRVVKQENELMTKGDWSLVSDPQASIWGQVVGMNGKHHPLLFDPKMSRLSLELKSDQRGKRRWVRLKILSYSLYKRIQSWLL